MSEKRRDKNKDLTSDTSYLSLLTINPQAIVVVRKGGDVPLINLNGEG